MNDLEFAAALINYADDVRATVAGTLPDRQIGAFHRPSGRTLYVVVWVEDDQLRVRTWDVDDGDAALEEAHIRHLWDSKSREDAIAVLEEHAAAHRGETA